MYTLFSIQRDTLSQISGSHQRYSLCELSSCHQPLLDSEDTSERSLLPFLLVMGSVQSILKHLDQ